MAALWNPGVGWPEGPRCVDIQFVAFWGPGLAGRTHEAGIIGFLVILWTQDNNALQLLFGTP